MSKSEQQQMIKMSVDPSVFLQDCFTDIFARLEEAAAVDEGFCDRCNDTDNNSTESVADGSHSVTSCDEFDASSNNELDVSFDDKSAASRDEFLSSRCAALALPCLGERRRNASSDSMSSACSSSSLVFQLMTRGRGHQHATPLEASPALDKLERCLRVGTVLIAEREEALQVVELADRLGVEGIEFEYV